MLSSTKTGKRSLIWTSCKNFKEGKVWSGDRQEKRWQHSGTRKNSRKSRKIRVDSKGLQPHTCLSMAKNRHRSLYIQFMSYRFLRNPLDLQERLGRLGTWRLYISKRQWTKSAGPKVQPGRQPGKSTSSLSRLTKLTVLVTQ